MCVCKDTHMHVFVWNDNECWQIKCVLYITKSRAVQILSARVCAFLYKYR